MQGLATSATCGTVPQVVATQSAKRNEHPCDECGVLTTRFFVKGHSGSQQIRTYYCPNHRPPVFKPSIWQNSRFRTGKSVTWQNREYILEQFNHDEAASIKLLDPATGDTVDVCPIQDDKIVGLALVSTKSDTENKRLIKAFAQSKVAQCPLTPVQIANDMNSKVFLPIKQAASEVVAAQRKAQGRIKDILVANADLIRWAREEFGAPGRRVPVPGAPTYTEWLEKNLSIELPNGEKTQACSDRYVRKVMSDLDDQLARTIKDGIEIPSVPTNKKVTTKPDPPPIPETSHEIYFEQLAKITDCLLGDGDYKVAPAADRFKTAQSLAAAVKEAMADGNTDRFTPQPTTQSVTGLLDFLIKQYETAMDTAFMLDTDAEIKKAIQQFGQSLADTYCPTNKKAVVTVEFVDKGAE